MQNAYNPKPTYETVLPEWVSHIQRQYFPKNAGTNQTDYKVLM